MTITSSINNKLPTFSIKLCKNEFILDENADADFKDDDFPKELIPGFTLDQIRIDALTISFPTFNEQSEYASYLFSSKIVTKEQLEKAKNPSGTFRYPCLCFFNILSTKLFYFLILNSNLKLFQKLGGSISRVDLRIASFTQYSDDYIDVFNEFKLANPKVDVFLNEKKILFHFGAENRNATHHLRIYQNTDVSPETMIFEVEFKKNMGWVNNQLYQNQSREVSLNNILIHLLKKKVELFNYFNQTRLLSHFKNPTVSISSYCLALQERFLKSKEDSLLTLDLKFREKLNDFPANQIPLVPSTIFDIFSYEKDINLKDKYSFIFAYFWFSFFSHWKNVEKYEVNLNSFLKLKYWEHSVSFAEFYAKTGLRQDMNSCKFLEQLVRYLGNLRKSFYFNEKKYNISIFPLLIIDNKKKELKFNFHPLLLNLGLEDILVPENILDLYKIFLKNYKLSRNPNKKVRIKTLHIEQFFKIISFHYSEKSTLFVKDLNFSIRIRDESVIMPMIELSNLLFPLNKKLLYDFKEGKISKI